MYFILIWLRIITLFNVIYYIFIALIFVKKKKIDIKISNFKKKFILKIIITFTI